MIELFLDDSRLCITIYPGNDSMMMSLIDTVTSDSVALSKNSCDRIYHILKMEKLKRNEKK